MFKNLILRINPSITSTTTFKSSLSTSSLKLNPVRVSSRSFAMSNSVPSGSRPHDAKKGEKGTPMTPIPSASLIVLCPIAPGTSSTPSSSPNPFSTLVLQRSARQGSSFRSAVVFPGGALDLADDHETGSDPNSKNIEDEKYLMALKLCSLRETFEETGLLLIPSQKSDASKGTDDESWDLPRCRAVGWKESGIEKEEWARIREEVHNDASKFVPFLSKVTYKIYPSISSNSNSIAKSTLPPLAPLSHHSNWITPRGVVRPAKRFDAHFFITLLDEIDVLGQIAAPVGQTVSSSTDGEQSRDLGLSADGGETTSLRVDTPERLCQAAMRDQIVLFPPQFYILADLATTVKNSSKKAIPPLVFNPTSSNKTESAPTSTFSSPIISKIEEEPREIPKGQNYSWDRKDEPVGLKGLDGNQKQNQESKSSSASDGEEMETTSWVKPPLNTLKILEKITSVEPKALPNQGSNVEISNLIKRGESGEFISESSSTETSREPEDEPFVFPLVLPGDHKASKEQKLNAGISDDTSSNGEGGLLALNRVFVSPRTKEEGGGLVVRGAMRRNVGKLLDFRVGICLEETEEVGGRGKL